MSKDAALLENHSKASESVDYSMDAVGFMIGETKVDGMLVLFGTNLAEEVPWCEAVWVRKQGFMFLFALYLPIHPKKNGSFKN